MVHYYSFAVHGLYLRPSYTPAAAVEWAILCGRVGVGAAHAYPTVLPCCHLVLCVTIGHHPWICVWCAWVGGWCADHSIDHGVCNWDIQRNDGEPGPTRSNVVCSVIPICSVRPSQLGDRSWNPQSGTTRKLATEKATCLNKFITRLK